MRDEEEHATGLVESLCSPKPAPGVTDALNGVHDGRDSRPILVFTHTMIFDMCVML